MLRYVELEHAMRVMELIKLQGPLVGELKSSKALAIEYANADPAYVRKTSVQLYILRSM
jgi:hypothetical protein